MKIYKDIDGYISNFPKEVQEKLEKIRKVIKENAKGANETISYGIPTFQLNGNLVHFAGYKKHISFYPTSSGITAFKEELKKYETSRGTVRFYLSEDLPYDLIKRIVKYRVKENTK